MRTFSSRTLGSTGLGGRQRKGILGIKSSVRQRSVRSSPLRRRNYFREWKIPLEMLLPRWRCVCLSNINTASSTCRHGQTQIDRHRQTDRHSERGTGDKSPRCNQNSHVRCYLYFFKNLNGRWSWSASNYPKRHIWRSIEQQGIDSLPWSNTSSSRARVNRWLFIFEEHSCQISSRSDLKRRSFRPFWRGRPQPQ